MASRREYILNDGDSNISYSDGSVNEEILDVTPNLNIHKNNNLSIAEEKIENYLPSRGHSKFELHRTNSGNVKESDYVKPEEKLISLNIPKSKLNSQTSDSNLNKLTNINTPNINNESTEKVKFCDLRNSCIFLKKKLELINNKKVLPNIEKTSWDPKKYINVISQQSRNLLKRSFSKFFQNMIEKVESKYGHGLSLYFDMIRFLFFMNLIMVTTYLFFLILPAKLTASIAIENTTDYNTLMRSSKLPLEIVSSNNNTIEECKVSTSSTTSKTEQSIFSYILSFLYGSPPFDKLLMFYGSYTTQKLPIGNSSYHIAYAYFYIWLVCNIISLILMISYYEPNMNVLVRFSSRILGCWNHRMISQKEIKLMKMKLACSLKSNLEEDQITETRFISKAIGNSYTKIRVMIWCCVIFTYIISCSLVYLANKYSKKININDTSVFNVFSKSIPVITASFMRLIFTPFINYITKYEKYSNTVTVTIILLRLFLLNVIVFATIFILVYVSSYNCGTCWEDILAGEIWSIATNDILFYFCKTAFIIICAIYKKTSSDFNLPSLLLQLVVDQMIVWIGMFFAPILIFVIMIKLLVMFFLQQFSLFISTSYCYIPYDSERLHRNIFLSLQFSYIVSLAISCYGMVRMRASCCGPFGTSLCANGTAQYSITIASFSHLPDIFQHFILVTQSPPFMYLYLTFLCFFCFYYRSNFKMCIIEIKYKKKQLNLAWQDKKYLLKHLKNELRIHSSGNEINGKEINDESNIKIGSEENINKPPRPSFTNTNRKTTAVLDILS